MPGPGHEHSETFERCLTHVKAQTPKGRDPDEYAHRACFTSVGKSEDGVQTGGYDAGDLDPGCEGCMTLAKEAGLDNSLMGWKDAEPWYNDRILETFISSEGIDKQGDSVDPKAITEVLPWLTKYGYYSWLHTDFPAGKIIGWKVKDEKPLIRVGFHDSASSKIPLHDAIWAKVKELGTRGASSIKGFPNLQKRIREGRATFNRIEDLGLYHVAYVTNPANVDAKIDYINQVAKSMMEKSGDVLKANYGGPRGGQPYDPRSISSQVTTASLRQIVTRRQKKKKDYTADQALVDLARIEKLVPAILKLVEKARVGGEGVPGPSLLADVQGVSGPSAPRADPGNAGGKGSAVEQPKIRDEIKITAKADTESGTQTDAPGAKPAEEGGMEPPKMPSTQGMPEEIGPEEDIMEILEILTDLMPGTQEAARAVAETARDKLQEMQSGLAQAAVMAPPMPDLQAQPANEAEKSVASDPATGARASATGEVLQKMADSQPAAQEPDYKAMFEKEKAAKEALEAKMRAPAAQPMSKVITEGAGVRQASTSGDVLKIAKDVAEGRATMGDYWNAVRIKRLGEHSSRPQTVMPQTGEGSANALTAEGIVRKRDPRER